MKIALRAANGRYVTVGADRQLHATAPDRSDRETFTVHRLDPGQMALETWDRRFWCAEEGGGGALHANREGIGPWEVWRVLGTLRQGAQIGFLAADTQHVICAELGTPTAPLTVTRTSQGPWESFTVEVLEGTALLPLVTDGWDIRTTDGARWIAKDATNFLLFQRYLEGQDCAPLLYEGFDGYRITLTMSIVPGQIGLRPLRPENYPGYYQRLETFQQWLTDQGKRAEFTVFCDQVVMGTSLEWQRQHFARVVEILQDTPHRLELANENEHGTNRINANDFAEPAGVYCCCGSSLGGEPCPLSHGRAWRYSAAHLPRDPQKVYTDCPPIYMIEGYPGYPGTHGPVTMNEPPGAGEVIRGWARRTEPEIFFRLGRMMSAWNGGTMHTEDGIFSRPLGPIQTTCAEAFLKGINTDGQ